MAPWLTHLWQLFAPIGSRARASRPRSGLATRMLHRSLVALLLLGLACAGPSGSDAAADAPEEADADADSDADADTEFEGDEGGECDDGADNDRDGDFDCDDAGCAASPACEEAVSTTVTYRGSSLGDVYLAEDEASSVTCEGSFRLTIDWEAGTVEGEADCALGDLGGAEGNIVGTVVGGEPEARWNGELLGTGLNFFVGGAADAYSVVLNGVGFAEAGGIDVQLVGYAE